MSDDLIANIVIDGSSCNSRALTNFVIGLFIASILLWLGIRFSNWRFGPTSNNELTGWSRSEVTAVLAILIALGTGFAMAAKQSESALSVTLSHIYVKGCRAGYGFNVIYDRSKLFGSYVFQRDRGGIYDRLEIKESDKRTTYFELGNEEQDRVFQIFAPDAMRAYADRLRSEGKKLPAELERL
jgi:hypothetical protein